MSGFWYFLGDLFQGIFKAVPFFGLWFNKFLIVVAFISFILWLRYMSRQKEVENFD